MHGHQRVHAKVQLRFSGRDVDSRDSASDTVVQRRRHLSTVSELPNVRFSGGVLPHVPWHFVHDRPLQPVLALALAISSFARERSSAKYTSPAA